MNTVARILQKSLFQLSGRICMYMSKAEGTTVSVVLGDIHWYGLAACGPVEW